MENARLRVKVLSSLPAAVWLHQLPHHEPVWGNCEFVFDRDAREYDWLLVYCLTCIMRSAAMTNAGPQANRIGNQRRGVRASCS